MAKQQKELDCDYEKNPTNLYLLIQQGDWDSVDHQAGHFPDEAKTFVSRHDATGLLKWRLLPIHCAILHDAPISTLETLLRAYKEGAQAKDDHDMLPMHLAIKKHVSPEVINLLLVSYPECVDVTNGHGMTPYQMAETSSSKHQAYYLRALKRGSPTYGAVTATMSDLLCGMSLPEFTSDPRTGFGLLANQ